MGFAGRRRSLAAEMKRKCSTIHCGIVFFKRKTHNFAKLILWLTSPRIGLSVVNIFGQMIFQNVCVLLSLSLAVVTGQDNAGAVLRESFLSFENDVIQKHPNLRNRRLQMTNMCTTSSGNVFICGGDSGGAADPCQGFTGTCDADAGTYACSCTELPDTQCNYCQVRTANAVVCQVTGSSTTFINLDGVEESCSCTYIGNSQVEQNCFFPTEAPFSFPSDVGITLPPLPTFNPDITLPPALSPAETAAPVVVPVETAAPVPLPAQTAPPVVVTAAPVAAPPADACVPDKKWNFYMCLGTADYCAQQATSPSSCNTEGNGYPCKCNGVATTCTYCLVLNDKGALCQHIGHTATNVTPLGGESGQTCQCKSDGNGVAVQNCFVPAARAADAIGTSSLELP